MKNIKVYSLRKLINGNSYHIIEFLYVQGTISACSLGQGVGEVEAQHFLNFNIFLLFTN